MTSHSRRGTIGVLIVAVALAGLAAGAGATSAQTAGDGPAVTTEWADPLGDSTMLVAANVTSLGTGDSANVSVEYRENGTDAWSETAPVTLRQTGQVRFEIADLRPETVYEYRAVAVGDNGTDRGEVRRFQTLEDRPDARTDPVAATSATEATLNGTVVDLGGAAEADVWFEYRAVGAVDGFRSAAQTVAEPGSVTQRVTGLDPDTRYEYRISVRNAEGERVRGEHVEFRTEPGLQVHTLAPRNVTETGATFRGEVVEFGGATNVSGHFEYRPADATAWNRTAEAPVSSAGTVERRVDGLRQDTAYEVRFVATASDGQRAVGERVPFETPGDPAVVTGAPADVGETTATLTGDLTDLGGAENATVGFAYRPADGNWTVTPGTDRSTTGAYEATVSGLAPNTSYEYRAVANASDGDAAAGAAETFRTDARPAVVTGSATAVGETNATVEATLENLGDADAATVRVEYRRAGAENWTATEGETLTAPGTVATSLTGLDSATEYEYRAAVHAADGDAAVGEVRTLTTERPTRPPAVESLALTDESPPNPHVRLTADWTVGDADGDLAAVTATVRDGDGAVVASDRRSLAGDAASGTLSTEVKHGAGETYELTVTVRDAAGNEVSERTTLFATRR